MSVCPAAPFPLWDVSCYWEASEELMGSMNSSQAALLRPAEVIIICGHLKRGKYKVFITP